ncbi:MAG: TRAP transporter large permease subunit [Gammaproteobacteria bacterium]
MLGIPVLAIKTLFYGTLPDVALIQKILGGINHSTLLAIPFFVLAAEFMASGRMPAGLLIWCKHWSDIPAAVSVIR